MDQYGNSVDGEISVPVKDFHTQQPWRPLTKDDWIDKVDAREKYAIPQRYVLGIDVAPKPVPLKTEKEWALAHADGSVNEQVYSREGTALGDLEYLRKQLKGYGIPEEYWPVLMERTVETVASSWRIRSE